MPNSEDEEPPTEVDPAYLAFFSKSVDDFRAHLAGRDGSDPPPASYFAPRTHWSSTEKDAFFRGLAVHSRLRPDLIAEEVKTKTVPDVLVYLATLAEAEREVTRGTTYFDGPNRFAGVKISRGNLPAALDVSEDWVALEERMANAMIAFQPKLDQEAVTQVREKEVQARRSLIRAPKGATRATSKERDREGEKARREEFDKWLAERKSDWEAEDMLLSLDRVRLKTLDAMLKDEEDGCSVLGEADGYKSEEEPSPLRATFDVEQADEQPSRVARIRAIDDQLIDPVLLELSQPASIFSSAAMPVPSGNAAGSSSVPEPLLSAFQPAIYSTPPVPSSSAPTSPQLSLHTTPTTTAAPSFGTNEGCSSIGNLSQMSPGARRRYQKRLYMRKKRAQATGGGVVEAAERLKPGRKPKKAASVKKLLTQDTRDAPSSPSTPGDALQPAALTSHDDHSSAPRAKAPRRSQQDSWRVEFTSKGINCQRLRREGFDLFHLQAIAKLMQTYNQLHNVPQSVGSAISGETLSMLHGLVVNFVAEVMSRAIVWREQERVAKLQTKAWRLRENQVISAANVKQALTLYGAESLNKHAHFARLLDEVVIDGDEADAEAEVVDEGDQHIPASSPAASGDRMGDTEDEEEEDIDGGADGLLLTPVSLLRIIFPAFTNPPSGPFENTSAAVDPSVYMPWPSSSLLFGGAEPPADDDLLPDHLDETTLANEIYEDVRLSREDRRRAVEEERTLWAMVNAKDPNPDLFADTVPSDPEDPPMPVEQPEQPRPKQKRKHRAVEGKADAEADGRGGEKAVEGGTTADAAMDVDERELAASKRRRVGRGGKKMNYLSQQQLLYMQPGADSRIKSSVYVLDSD